jgi:hypothetical protein
MDNFTFSLLISIKTKNCVTNLSFRCDYFFCVTDEGLVGKALEGSGHGLIEILFQNLPGGTEGNHENVSEESRCPYKDFN